MKKNQISMKEKYRHKIEHILVKKFKEMEMFLLDK